MYWLIKDYGFFYHVTIATVIPFYGMMFWRKDEYIVLKG